MNGFIKHDGFCGEITRINSKANFGNILQKVAGVSTINYNKINNLFTAVIGAGN